MNTKKRKNSEKRKLQKRTKKGNVNIGIGKGLGKGIARVKFGGQINYKYNELPFGKIENKSITRDIGNRIYNSFGINKIGNTGNSGNNKKKINKNENNKNYLDMFLQSYKDNIFSLDKLDEIKKNNLDRISKFQLVDIIYNPNKKLEFVFNHSINRPETITAGKPGYHIYVFIIPLLTSKTAYKYIYKYELMSIITNL
jgi:hypothetical protein